MVFVFETGLEHALDWQEDAITPEEREIVAYSIAAGAVWRSEEDGLVLNLDKALMMRIEVEGEADWSEEKVSLPVPQLFAMREKAEEYREMWPRLSGDWAYFQGKVDVLKELLGEDHG